VKKTLTYLLFFGISAILLYFTFKDTDFSKMKESVYTLSPFYLILCFFVTLSSHYLRAVRWKLLLEPMGYKARTRTGFYAVMIGYLTNYAIPRGGELARCGVMFGTDKIPVDKLLGTVVTERIIDVLLLFAIFILTLLIEFSTINNFLHFDLLWEQYHNLFYLLIGLAVGGLLFIIIFWKKVAEIGFVKKILGVLHGFNEGLLSVFKIKKQLLFWALSVGIWVGFFFINYTFMKAMPITAGLSWKVVLVVLAMGAVGFAIPTPGGTGSYHYIIKMTLVFYMLSAADAETYALVSHTAQAAFVAVAGSICLYLTFIERKKVSNESPATVTN
jgi:uncharacterized protein (TIRG00374 family)